MNKMNTTGIFMLLMATVYTFVVHTDYGTYISFWGMFGISCLFIGGLIMILAFNQWQYDYRLRRFLDRNPDITQEVRDDEGGIDWYRAGVLYQRLERAKKEEE